MSAAEPERVVFAAVPDLMDRSRLAAPGVEIVSVAAAGLRAAVEERRSRGEEVALAVVDLSRPGALEAVAGVDVVVVGFAPHVDDALLAEAKKAGVIALPRSKFFTRWPDVG